MRLTILALLVACAFATGGVALADAVDDGVDAAMSGDYATAIALLSAGVSHGDARAEFFLGVMYESGRGVAKDTTEAAKYYRLSADQGLAAAQNNLASLYADGDGVAQNGSEAIHLWLLAADQGLPVAQANLASSYATGTHVRKDLVQAYKWATLAAAQGYGDGAEILAAIAAVIAPAERAVAERLVYAWRPSETIGS
jgi:TPR repeat protein